MASLPHILLRDCQAIAYPAPLRPNTFRATSWREVVSYSYCCSPRGTLGFGSHLPAFAACAMIQTTPYTSYYPPWRMPRLHGDFLFVLSRSFLSIFVR